MTAYAIWNNKGGVGKSYLTFVAACEYAHNNPDANIVVVDLCPQANSSEILLGSAELSKNYRGLLRTNARKTVGGYFESRLNSPFSLNRKFSDFAVRPSDYNKHIPKNLQLISGDYLLEILSEAMRQAAQLSVPLDAWSKVTLWVRDLVNNAALEHADHDNTFFIDCNPSFAIYTQMAISAADKLIIPFTADDSSRRAIENVFALIYGIGDEKTSAYARISYYNKATENNVSLPEIHSFINNRVTLYEGKPSAAFRAASQRVKDTVDAIFKNHKTPFAIKKRKPSEAFVEIPDYHSAAIVSSVTGTPIHRLKPGPKNLGGERIQLNKEPLDRYRDALENFISVL